MQATPQPLPPPRKKPLRNGPERAFEELARAQSWNVSKRGWPDFICFDSDGRLFVVEVKPRLRSRVGKFKMLKREQMRALDALKALGIPCYVSDGHVLDPYDKDRHAPEHRRFTRDRSQ